MFMVSSKMTVRLIYIQVSLLLIMLLNKTVDLAIDMKNGIIKSKDFIRKR